MREQDPNRSSRLPAYWRIARELRERIATGTYRPDEFLPAERDLAREFQASRQTIRLAIDALRQEGLLIPEQGRGTRVVDITTAETPGSPASNQFRLAALIIYGISREGSAAILQGCQSVARQ